MSPALLTELRQEIANLCQQIVSGQRSFVELISLNESDRSAAESYVYVVKALEAESSVGKVRARRIMADLGIAERCNIGSLTALQVELLKAALHS
jgi:Spy/CpxP family protein refolding chaperone